MKRKAISLFMVFLMFLSIVTPVLADTGRQQASVKRIIDGDTIVLRNRQIIRLIGIDAPETRERFGPQATNALRRMIGRQPVRLVFDVRRTDNHGRVLAYIYNGDVLINEQMVLKGFASTLTIPPNTLHQALFENAEQIARTKQRGMWAETRNTTTRGRSVIQKDGSSTGKSQTSGDGESTSIGNDMNKTPAHGRSEGISNPTGTSQNRSVIRRDGTSINKGQSNSDGRSTGVGNNRRRTPVRGTSENR